MIKKILIFITIILILIGAGLAYAALNLNSLINKFKPELETLAKNTLGEEVKLGNLEASIFPATSILIKELKLGGQNTQKFQLKSLSLNVNLKTLLLSRKLEITKLIIDSPEIAVRKTDQGMEISGLPKHTGSIDKPVRNESQPAASSAPPIALNLKALEVNNAKLVLNNFLPGKEITANNIDIKSALQIEGQEIKVSDFNLTCTLLDKIKTKLYSGNINLNNQSGELSVPDLQLSLNDDKIMVSAAYNLKNSSATSKLKSESLGLENLINSAADFLPSNIKSMNLKGSIKPDLSIIARLPDYSAEGNIGLADLKASVNQFNVSKLNGNLKIKADKLKQHVESNDLDLVLNDSNIKIITDSNISFPEVNITKLVVNAFSGTLSTAGRINTGSPITFNLQNQIQNINIDSLIKTLSPGNAIVQGTIEKANADLQGTLDSAFMQNLKGNVYYVLSDGSLKGFNLGGQVLKAVNNLSFLSGSLYDRVQGKKNLFDVADTVVKKSTGNINISNGSMYTKDLQLTSTAYDLSANGRIGFDASLDLKANIIFTPEISETLVASVKEFSKILDEQKRLNIPLSLQGKAPAVIVLPDMKKLLELGAKAYLRDKAADLLENAIKKKAGSSGLGGLLGF